MSKAIRQFRVIRGASPNYRTLLGAATILLAVSVFAQQPDIIGLSDYPVPAWPASGIVGTEMKDKYVFVDLPKNEYVIAYPENLGTETFATNPGKMKINRYELLRNVAPSVSLTISPMNGGKLRYSYTVANAASAKQSIDQWVMVLPAAAATDTIKHPEGWFGIMQRSRTYKVKNPEWLPNGTAAIWSFEKLDKVIPPGAAGKGFELETELRPGFTVAYARKSESIDVKVTTHGNVPKEVKDQLDPLLQIEYNSRTILTFGPKFDKNADDAKIAEDYIQGIITLSRAGVIDLSSDFARNTMSELTAIKPGAKASVKLTPPKTPAETELSNALKVSLRLN